MKSNNRIESLIPGPAPKFVKSNDEFGIISIRAAGKGETQPEELAAPAEDRYQRAGRLRAEFEIALGWTPEKEGTAEWKRTLQHAVEAAAVKEIDNSVAWLIAPVQEIVDSIHPIFTFFDDSIFYRIFADGRVEKHEIEPTEGVPSDGIHPAINNIVASLLQLISTISDQVEAARKP